MKRVMSFSMCLLMICVLLLACGKKQELEVSIEASVLPLTDEQYEEVGTSGLENPVKEDFRKVTVHVEANQIPEPGIEAPSMEEWKHYINAYDRTDRMLYGNFTNTPASHTSEFVIYSKGLSEEDIKKAFSTLTIKIPADSENGQSGVYYVSDYFVFDHTD
ncbi:hypothetical protein [Paenibacillus tarimensis]|uniref:hypothetical protein n=1 Tax=Paenibacillus tarimensis TaxID=416012 RepID=UPI001F16A097|nr:hypothetical protein [Paenibacillus tarimensis]MCF2946037.1 hypothetical protein [Paenibacillus tarimensis]